MVKLGILEVFIGLVRFVSRQRGPYRINMVRTSAQNFILSLTRYYQSIYIVALGASVLQFGILNSVGELAGAIVSLYGGWLAEFYGTKRMFLIATIFFSLASLIFSLATNWIFVIPALLFSVMALRMSFTVCPIVCRSTLINEERATGMQICDTLTSIPNFISPVVAASLITAFGGLTVDGIKPLYLIQLACFSIIFIWVLKMFKEPYEIGSERMGFTLISDLKVMFRYGGRVKKWIVYYLLSSLPYCLSVLFWPLYAAEVKGADQYILGGMATTMVVAPILLSILTGKLADMFGRKKVLYVTIPIYIISLLLLIYAEDALTLLISAFLQGFLMLSGVTQAAMTAEMLPVSLAGRWYGFLGLMRAVVYIPAPILAGWMWGSIAPASVFHLLIIIQIIQLLLLTAIPETLRSLK